MKTSSVLSFCFCALSVLAVTLVGCQSAPERAGDEPRAVATGEPSAIDTAETSASGDSPGQLHRLVAAEQLAGDGSCIGEQSPVCPDAAATVPRCSEIEADPLTLGEVHARQAELLGTTVLVHAELAIAPGACTEIACERQCCTTCSAQLFLLAPDTFDGRTLHLDIHDRGANQAWQCLGDESALCCATAVPDGPVLATGTLADHAQGLYLQRARLCTP